MHISALLRGAVLAELEFAFDARDGDAKSHDAREHGPAKALWQCAPMFKISRFMRRDEIGEERLFTGIVVDERESAVSVNSDVVPCGHREFFDIKSWRNVTVRSREDGESFTPGERLPVGIGFGEMALKNAMLPFIFDDERKVSCRDSGAGRLPRRRTE